MKHLLQSLTGLPVQLYLIISGVLGYTAILITGFGSGLGENRPLFIYFYLGLMLLGLQAAVTADHSARHIIYVYFGSIFFLYYAAQVVFFGNDPGNFTRQPLTYVILNLVLFTIFFYDVISRRRQPPVASQGTQDPTLRILGGIAADTFSFAVLAYFISISLAILADKATIATLNNNPLLKTPILPSPPCGGYACVDVHQLPIPLDLGVLSPLGKLDLVLALVAVSIWLLLFGLIGVLIIGNRNSLGESYATDATVASNPILRFLAFIRTLLAGGISEALLSLRLTFSELIWLVPAFSIAEFSKDFATYLSDASHCFGDSVCPNNLSPGALAFRLIFPPFNETFLQALRDLGLAMVAVIAVLAAVAVAEHKIEVLNRTVSILNVAGQTVAVTLIFFFFSLMALNAVLYIAGITTVLPFQIGPSGFIALVAAIGLTVWAGIRQRRQLLLKPSPLP